MDRSFLDRFGPFARFANADAEPDQLSVSPKVMILIRGLLIIEPLDLAFQSMVFSATLPQCQSGTEVRCCLMPAR
jgi:hypothetical protein